MQVHYACNYTCDESVIPKTLDYEISKYVAVALIINYMLILVTPLLLQKYISSDRIKHVQAN